LCPGAWYTSLSQRGANPRAPFTSNEAEWNLQMGKVWMKVAGSLRPQKGAKDFYTLRTVIETTGKQGWGIPETLNMTAKQLVQKLHPA